MICGAQSDRDCVVAYNLPRVKLITYPQSGILRPAAVPKHRKKMVQEKQLLLPSFGGVSLTGLFILVTTFCSGRMVAVV